MLRVGRGATGINDVPCGERGFDESAITIGNEKRSLKSRAPVCRL